MVILPSATAAPSASVTAMVNRSATPSASATFTVTVPSVGTTGTLASTIALTVIFRPVLSASVMTYSTVSWFATLHSTPSNFWSLMVTS